MESKTDRKSRRRRKISLYLTITVHTAVLVLLFLPILTRLDLSDLGVPGTGQSDFEIRVDHSAMGTSQPEILEEKELEKESKSASSHTEEETKAPDAPNAIPVKTEDTPKKAKLELVSNPDEESVVEAAPKKIKSADTDSEPSSSSTSYTDVFGKIAPVAGGNGNVQAGPNDSVKGLESSSLTEGIAIEGMQGRYPIYSPDPDTKIPENGRVVVRICVDKYGEVTRAEYTQAGTMASTYLKQLAESNSCKWRFNPGTRSLQCGKIVYDFRVE